MYTKLLEETIRELKGEDLEDDRRATVNLGIEFRIDEATSRTRTSGSASTARSRRRAPAPTSIACWTTCAIDTARCPSRC